MSFGRMLYNRCFFALRLSLIAGLIVALMPASAGADADRGAHSHSHPPRKDCSTELDENGLVRYRISPVVNDEPLPVAQMSAIEAVYPLNLLPKLHSNPGATAKVHLDFDGNVHNGVWGSNRVTPPYSIDADTTTFSDSEIDAITEIWKRVAEDFAPFNIDVTTEAPASSSDYGGGKVQHVCIGGSYSDWYGSAAGGVAYVGIFSWNGDIPAYVFENNLGNGNTKYTAEAASHEVGHTLGLHHQSRYNGSGGLVESYHSGDAGWAPIMGVGYYQALTTWHNGTTSSASTFQNDLSIITGAGNGFGYRADDHSNSNSGATGLTVSSGVNVSGSGIISTSSDVDVFRFDTGAGTVTLSADPAAVGNNLDITLELRSASSTLLASDNPGSSNGAALSTSLSAGTYYLFVKGNGSYGRLGQYTVSGTIVAAPVTYQISGSVLLGSTPLQGVTLSYAGTTTVSGANGAYTLTGLSAGSGTLGASLAGYNFAPSGWSNPLSLSTNLSGLLISGSCAAGYVESGGVCVVPVPPPDPPSSLTATDATAADAVYLNWAASSGATSYELYRSEFGSDLGEMIASGIAGTSFADVSAIPGVRYRYTLQARGQGGTSGYSSAVQGRRTGSVAPLGVQDLDGDGVGDADEASDGTNPLERGNFRKRLHSPVFTKYNTFLGQWNFLELVNPGDVPLEADVTVYAINGSVKNVARVSVAPSSQIDVDINTLAAQSDTYGVIRIDFNENAGGILAGRMSNYRPDSDGSFSFAFAREFRNPTFGKTFATANSMDPQGTGRRVPNWLEIVNLDTVARNFYYRISDQAGTVLLSRLVTAPPLGEVDSEAGHQFGESVYVIEVWPEDGQTPYLGAVTRYSPGSTAGAYQYAFPVDTRAGSGGTQVVSMSNLRGSCWSQSNWLELTNVRERPATATISFRDQNGASVGAVVVGLPAHAQQHFNAGALLPAGQIGSAEVSADIPGALLGQSAVYFHDCQSNRLQSAYMTPIRLPSSSELSGSYNRFIDIGNYFFSINAGTASAQATARFKTGTTDLGQQTVNIPASGSLRISGMENLPSDSYGTIRVEPQGSGTFAGENVRIREVDGRVDFAMPTLLE